MKINQLESRNYTTYLRGRAYDNVTEYSLVSTVNLDLEQFKQVLEQECINLTGGVVSFIKKKLSLKSGKTLYRHITKLEISVN